MFLSGVIMWSPRLWLIMLWHVMPVKITPLINGFEGNLRRLKKPHLHFAMSTFFCIGPSLLPIAVAGSTGSPRTGFKNSYKWKTFLYQIIYKI
jgi:hypothetical protein